MTLYCIAIGLILSVIGYGLMRQERQIEKLRIDLDRAVTRQAFMGVLAARIENLGVGELSASTLDLAKATLAITMRIDRLEETVDELDTIKGLKAERKAG